MNRLCDELLVTYTGRQGSDVALNRDNDDLYSNEDSKVTLKRSIDVDLNRDSIVTSSKQPSDTDLTDDSKALYSNNQDSNVYSERDDRVKLSKNNEGKSNHDSNVKSKLDVVAVTSKKCSSVDLVTGGSSEDGISVKSDCSHQSTSTQSISAEKYAELQRQFDKLKSDHELLKKKFEDRH